MTPFIKGPFWTSRAMQRSQVLAERRRVRKELFARFGARLGPLSSLERKRLNAAASDESAKREARREWKAAA